MPLIQSPMLMRTMRRVMSSDVVKPFWYFMMVLLDAEASTIDDFPDFFVFGLAAFESILGIGPFVGVFDGGSEYANIEDGFVGGNFGIVIVEDHDFPLFS